MIYTTLNLVLNKALKEKMKIIQALLLLSTIHSTAFAISNEEATTLVKEKLNQTEVFSSKHYCIKGTMTCRTMYTLREKNTKEPVDIFYDTFYSADRQVGSTCYFLSYKKNGNTYYYQASDTVFDGQIKIDLIGTELAQISQKEGTIIFADLYFKKLGTTKYRLGDMIQTEEKVVINGTMYDTEDKNYKEVAPSIEYYRVFP